MSEFRVKRRKIYVEDNNEKNIIINLFKNQELKINKLFKEINNDLKKEINELKEIILEQKKLLKKKIDEKEMCEDMKNAYI